MEIDKGFGQYTDDEQQAICQHMAQAWKQGARLLRRRDMALTADERTALGQALGALAAQVRVDTNTLLPS